MNKKIKDLRVGDVVGVTDPDGWARVTKHSPTRLFRASGGCYMITVKRLDNDEYITNQAHGGDEEVVCREAAEA